MITPIILIIGGLLGLAVGPGLIYLAKRRDDAIKRSIEWQFEKHRRFQAGWRPTLWDEDATSEEKLAALDAYLYGRPLPECKRPPIERPQRRQR
jgi:hypothetical protein